MSDSTAVPAAGNVCGPGCEPGEGADGLDADARVRVLEEPAGRPAPSPASRMRALITLFFLLDGFVFANWVVRVPQVKAQVNASAGLLGLALLGVSIGAIVTMPMTGWACGRWGSRRMIVVTAAVFAVAEPLPGRVSSVAALAAVLALLGAGWGGMNVALNSAAVDVIEELGRPVMPSFHAAYSLGGLLGALVGGALAGVLSTATHLALIGALALVATAGLGAALLRRPRRAEPPQTTAPEKSRQAQEPASANAGGAAAAETGVAHPGAAQQSIAEPDVTAPEAAGPPSGRRTAVIVLIFSLIALCSAYGEGALADWGALHLRTDLHTGAGLAAGGYAAFSVAMVIGRLSGSRALRAVGRTAVLAGGGACAALGMLDAALVPSLPWALPGFVLVGLGLSNIFPAAVGRAGQLRGPAGVAAASTLGYGGFLTGPPLIGFLADRVGLPIALTSICVLAGAVSLLALAADRAEPGRERERGRVREAVSATEAEA